MKTSVLVEDVEHCIFCGSSCVEEHHVFFGTADRQVADRYGFVVPLCNAHHTGSADCPHKNRVVDLALKCWAQTVFESKFGDRNDFRRLFRRSYL